MEHKIIDREFVVCEMCQKKLQKIDNRHLKKKHNVTFEEYRTKFPEAPTITTVQREKDLETKRKREETKRNKSQNVMKECWNYSNCGNRVLVNVNVGKINVICESCKNKGLYHPNVLKEREKKAERFSKMNQDRNVINTRTEKLRNRSPEEIEEFRRKRAETLEKKLGPNWKTILASHTRESLLKIYGKDVYNNINKKREQTYYEKTGFKNAMHNPDVKEVCVLSRKENNDQNEITERTIKTNIEKYGVEYPTQNPDIIEKRRKNNREKWGVKSPMQLSEVQEKAKQTNQNKYGVEYPIQNPNIKEIRKQNSRKKYGVDSHMQLPEMKEKFSIIQRNKFIPLLQKQLNYLNLELLDPEYIGAHIKHNWKCTVCDYEFQQIWNALQQGYLCPKCYPRNQGFSKGEKEVCNFIKSLDFIIIENSRQIIPPYELDIYIPSNKIAIEFHGLYWHSEDFCSDPKRLSQKMKLCNEKGIRLIQIFEDEWVLKKEIVESRLTYLLQKRFTKLIHGRKCIIQEIDSKTKNAFLEKYHIQGSDNSTIKLGAFHNDELVSVMTFSKGNRAKGSKFIDGVWELNRFCSNFNYHIPGIASKLLEYFKRNYKWKEIFSYADLRWSVGNVYNQLGFKTDNVIRLNYWYSKNGVRYHRFGLRKRPDEPKDITESVLRTAEGFIRIWDAGNLKFVLKK